MRQGVDSRSVDGLRLPRAQQQILAHGHRRRLTSVTSPSREMKYVGWRGCVHAIRAAWAIRFGNVHISVAAFKGAEVDARTNGPARRVKGLPVFALIRIGPIAQRAKRLTGSQDAERVDERLFDRG